MREEHEKRLANASKKIDDILTADQKAAIEKLRGKPFDLSMIRTGPGPGGPPPGGPDGGGGANERPNRRGNGEQ